MVKKSFPKTTMQPSVCYFVVNSVWKRSALENIVGKLNISFLKMDALVVCRVAAHCRRAESETKSGMVCNCESEETFGYSRFNFCKILSSSNFSRRNTNCNAQLSKEWHVWKSTVKITVKVHLVKAWCSCQSVRVSPLLRFMD